MKFTMYRDREVASTTGRSINFVKGEAVHVPPEMWEEVMNLGGVPEDDLPDPLPTDTDSSPQDPTARKQAIQDAFSMIVLRGSRNDFTAGGAPNAKAMQTALGWSIDARERDVEWVAFQNKE